jgi:hypothetical protein
MLVFLAGSCASGTKATVKDIDWGSRIGTYTYEEALAELGEPNVIGESSEGKIAEWVLRRSPMVSFWLWLRWRRLRASHIHGGRGGNYSVTAAQWRIPAPEI